MLLTRQLFVGLYRHYKPSQVWHKRLSRTTCCHHSKLQFHCASMYSIILQRPVTVRRCLRYRPLSTSPTAACQSLMFPTANISVWPSVTNWILRSFVAAHMAPGLSQSPVQLRRTLYRIVYVIKHWVLTVLGNYLKRNYLRGERWKWRTGKNRTRICRSNISENVGPENARLEYGGLFWRAGKCRTGLWRTISQQQWHCTSETLRTRLREDT